MVKTAKQMTLGSLFDGIGGFPLAGVYAGMKPVWASEIEPFPIRVTEKRLPGMKHYGDIHRRNGLCGRMCRAPCPLTMGRISGRSLKASSASKTPKQMFLCRRTINGCRQERSWATVILSPGECSTRRRVGASHKDENVYLLSSILQDNAPDRYSLSPKACRGILRRAAKRGKELPQVLREALERQAAQG